MNVYLVELEAVDDSSLRATLTVMASDKSEAGELALDQEWDRGANWSNGEQMPDTGGVRVVNIAQMGHSRGY